MAKRIFSYFKKRPGFAVLLIILALIAAANLNSTLYLLGWDNYSSYFNIKSNLFRTFFATWRQYRGVGVPSDSESADIFRQLFFAFTSPFLPVQLLDQLYLVFSLCAGTLSVYFLATRLFAKHLRAEVLDGVGFMSALAYLFNLHTLATFYFPMIMFVNRFYSIPLILLSLITIIERGKHPRVRDYVLFCVIVIATSGTYMTATVFITLMMFLILFFSFNSTNIKQTLWLMYLVIALNSFWLLPFANYTMQKSTSVNDAPTFIEANEIQLNKPDSYYAFVKQLTMYPGFFDTAVTNLGGTEAAGYHPITSSFANPWVRGYISLLSLIGLSGSILIMIKGSKNRPLFWIPVTFFLFLLLALKAFSPLGPIYVFFEKNVPFFANLFRFGDTKFHFFIALSGSLAAGYFIGMISSKTPKKLIIILLGIFCLGAIFTYRDYFNSHLFGFFMRNDIPEAYFKTAKILNDDTRDGRVLHIPYDANGYWRSYSWGYLGSSFLHFMIDRPLLEKTFEPASAENAHINSEVINRLAHMQAVKEQGAGKREAQEMYEYLRKIGVRYILLDETVSAQQSSRGINLWGRFNPADAQAMISLLEQQYTIREVAKNGIEPQDYLATYEKQFPLTEKQIEEIQKSPPQYITLYELIEPEPQVKITDTGILRKNYTPLKTMTAQYSINDAFVNMDFPDVNLEKGKSYTVSVPKAQDGEDMTRLEVYAKTDSANLILSIYDSTVPEIRFGDLLVSDRFKIKEISIPLARLKGTEVGVTERKRYLSNWAILPSQKFSGVRVRIGHDVLPLPELSSNDRYVGAIQVAQNDMELELLIQERVNSLNTDDFRMTDTPNCFADAISDYVSYSSKTESTATFGGKNGSTCFIADLAPYASSKETHMEVRMEYEAVSGNLDSNLPATSKPVLEKSVQALDKPNNLYACIKDESLSSCFNTHQVADLKEKGTLILPTETAVSAIKPIILFALKNTGFQSQEITMRTMRIATYESVFESTLVIPQSADRSYYVTAEENAEMLSVLIAAPVDGSSFYQGENDGFLLSNGSCERPGSYRTFRRGENGGLLSYFVNCDNSMFVTLPFSSDNAYIWSLDYNLASGKFPRFILGDGFFNYKNDIFSLNQGYPAIAGFKQFQYPETFLASEKNTGQALQSLPLVKTYTIVPPHPQYGDLAEKGFTVMHDSENEGVALYRNFSVMALPGRWYNMAIRQVGDGTSQVGDKPVTYANILPSLWSVDTQGKKGVLVFNEGYDSQWGLYASLGDLLLGKEMKVGHVRCKDYFNCFTVEGDVEPKYIFYYPEKLNVLGWMCSLLAVGIALLVVRWKRTHLTRI